MYDFERAFETVALSATRAIMQVRIERLWYAEPIPHDIRDAITAITFDETYGARLQHLLDTSRRTGVRATIEYAYSLQDDCMRFGLIHRRVSGIPYDKRWWTGDPSNLIS